MYVECICQVWTKKTRAPSCWGSLHMKTFIGKSKPCWPLYTGKGSGKDPTESGFGALSLTPLGAMIMRWVMGRGFKPVPWPQVTAWPPRPVPPFPCVRGRGQLCRTRAQPRMGGWVCIWKVTEPPPLWVSQRHSSTQSSTTHGADLSVPILQMRTGHMGSNGFAQDHWHWFRY